MIFNQFFSLIKKTFHQIAALWKKVWSSLFRYEFFWDLFLQFSRQIGSALTSLNVSFEENATASLDHPQGKPDHGDLKEQMGRLQEISSATLKRFNEVEEEIQHLKSDLCEEKILWNNRYYELLQEQLVLKQQLKSARGVSQNEETFHPVNPTVHDEADALDGEGQLLNVGQDSLHRRVGAQLNSSLQSWQDVTCGHQNQQEVTSSQRCLYFPAADRWSCSDGQNSTSSFPMSLFSRPSSVASVAGSSSGRRSQNSFRVFVPHSRLHLQSGQRVKVLLESGKVGIGVVRYLGHLPKKVDFYVGVDLEAPEYGQHDGVFSGHCYFRCKPGHGVFVPFSKVLLAWK